MGKRGRPKTTLNDTRTVFDLNVDIYEKYKKHFNSNKLSSHFIEILNNWVENYKNDKNKKITIYLTKTEYAVHRFNTMFPKDIVEQLEEIRKKYGYTSNASLIRNILSEWIEENSS